MIVGAFMVEVSRNHPRWRGEAPFVLKAVRPGRNYLAGAGTTPVTRASTRSEIARPRSPTAQ